MNEDLLTEIQSLSRKFSEEIGSLKDPNLVLKIKADYLGKKGYLSGLLSRLPTLSSDLRPVIGKEANLLKNRIEEECRSLLESLKGGALARQAASEGVDVTLPGRLNSLGRLHPVRQVMAEAEAIFVSMGFQVHEGPEIETDYYNFEALNIPKDHPAREMQDTFYIKDQKNELLRTHTSPVQIHVMQKKKPPIQMIAPGVVYRRDSDVSHTPMFHQVEGLLVDEGIRFSDLKGTLTLFVHQFFDPKVRVRFRPSYFPFTEPSAEVDIGCVACRGKGCRICKQSGWLEVMGCGMVSPAVFGQVKYDSEKWTGYAFGMGLERLAMLKFGINDIRLFFENDVRFLQQF
ncbi:MAG: phenylalanine--tRNA ligase subunit alpha [bacterium]|nr:phenylalanine--tRNA ligase subunit alpha [bacterium]